MWEFVREFLQAIRACCHDCSQEHYNEGYEDNIAGKVLADNPYPPQSFAHADWEHGWVSCERSFNAE